MSMKDSRLNKLAAGLAIVAGLLLIMVGCNSSSTLRNFTCVGFCAAGEAENKAGSDPDAASKAKDAVEEIVDD